MKIAIAISGLARNYHKAHQYYQEQLINPNKHHKIKVYISTWDHTNTTNTHENDRRTNLGQPKEKGNPLNTQEINDLYHPSTLQIHHAHDHGELNNLTPHPGHNLQAILNMYYKIKTANELINEEHDIIIRTRFDLNYRRPLIIDELTPSPHHVIVPSMTTTNWTNDKFCIATKQTMTTYAKVYDNLQQLATQVPIQPEALLHQHLKNHNIVTKELGHELDIVR